MTFMPDIQALRQQIINSKNPVPGHLAMVMDGNRRWAKANKLKLMLGHDGGAKKADALCRWAMDIGVRELSLWAFSTENFKRDQAQIDYLMEILREYIKRYLTDDFLAEHQIQVKFMGQLHRLPPDLQTMVQAMEKKTAGNTGMRLNGCIAYGGRQEIVDAMSAIAKAVAVGELSPSEITMETLSAHMYPFAKAPDLIVRTGGEQRTSGFLLWHSDYTEWYFSDILFPDFTEADFYHAVANYQARERRFGG